MSENKQTQFDLARLLRRILPEKFESRNVILLCIIIILMVVFTFTNPNFFALSNFYNILRQSSALAVIAIAMTFVIINRGFDISTGSNVAFAGAVGAIIYTLTGSPLLFFISVFGAAMLIGLINGIMIGVSNLSPFIATLATMALARGLALGLTGAASIRIVDPSIIWLGQASYNRIPVVIFLVIILYLIFNKVLQRNVYGRNCYAVGGNWLASKATGIKARYVTLSVYVLTGFFVAIGTVITVGRLGSAQPWAGLGLEFEVITAVILGGTSLFGGEGNMKGTFLGVLLVGILGNGLHLMAVPFNIQFILKGVLLLTVVIIDNFGRQYSDILLSLKDKKFKAKKPPVFISNKALQLGGDRNLLVKQVEKVKTLSVEDTSKNFPGVKALENVNITIKSGKVHALVGENGAGKSTLVNVISGVHKKDSGVIKIDGEVIEIDSPRKAQDIGISVIHQEFALISELSVMQNIFIGKEISSKGFLSKRTMVDKTKELLKRLQVDVDINTPVKNLSVGEQQMVEVAKALNSDAWIIFMDEPTSALTESDKERLFLIIDELRSNNIAVVFISHRMQEIFSIADEVTVLRDGKHILTEDISKVNEGLIISKMVGRQLDSIYKRKKAPLGNTVLEVKDLTRHGLFKDISFQVREGEVLSLSGLMGSRRTEVVRCIFGLDAFNEGEILFNGTKVDFKHPKESILLGMAFCPEDRKREGFIPKLSVKENISLPSLPSINKMGWINSDKEKQIAESYISALGIRTPSLNQLVVNLSGGNQQKVTLAKWLALNPRLLILDEPTRGIDVGAKVEIHRIIERLAKEGIAIIMVSSELPEVLGISDNVIVLCRGEVTGRFNTEDATEEKLIYCATGAEYAS